MHNSAHSGKMSIYMHNNISDPKMPRAMPSVLCYCWCLNPIALKRKGDYLCFAASPACGVHVYYLTPAMQQKQRTNR